MIYIRPEQGMDNMFGPTYGPFEYLQITYLEVHCDGEPIAYMDDRKWFIYPGVKQVPSEKAWPFGVDKNCQPEDGWSDIVIFEDKL